jgi:hypothetical protein
MALAEIEGDGDPDLVTVSRDRAGSVSVLVNDGSGRFYRQGTYGSGSKDAYAVAAGDIEREPIGSDHRECFQRQSRRVRLRVLPPLVAIALQPFA